MKHTYLVGFQCVNKSLNIGCECTIDIPDIEKKRFEKNHGFEYDEYCHYDLSEGETESEALNNAYSCQGATETETAKEIWPVVEIIERIDLK